MKTWCQCRQMARVFAAVALGCSVIGCANGLFHPRTTAAKTEPDRAQAAPPQFGAAPARITSVHAQYRFVVVDFSSRAMPPLGTQLTVYRDGQRVGVIQITEPVRGQLATADILEGDLLVGDEAR